MERHVFLDLEETIITNFNDAVLCNVQTVTDFLRSNKIDEVSIFSFAIWDEKDRTTFNVSMKQWLSDVLGVNIKSVPTQQEILLDVMALTGIRFEMWELSQIWGKDRSFIDFCRFHFKNAQCILLDDVVPNQTLIDHDNNLTIELVNVKKIRTGSSIHGVRIIP